MRGEEPPLVVGLLTLSFRLPEARSLKDKRSVAKRVIARLRARFNVAVAEVEDQDHWGTLTLGIACVSTRSDHARGLLDRVADFVEADRLDLELVDVRVEIL